MPVPQTLSFIFTRYPLPLLSLITLTATADVAPAAPRRVHSRMGVRAARRAGGRAGDARRRAPRIGGGVPSTEADIRLGDVVVSQPHRVHGGVVQYDSGKTTLIGFERTGSLNSPPHVLLT